MQGVIGQFGRSYSTVLPAKMRDKNRSLITLFYWPKHMGYCPSFFGQDGWTLAKFFFVCVYGLG